VGFAEQLVAAGARVAKDAQPGPLDTAASSGLERVVAILLAAGGEVNAIDRSGYTPLVGAVLSTLGGCDAAFGARHRSKHTQ
jgi:hypothetical protein